MDKRRKEYIADLSNVIRQTLSLKTPIDLENVVRQLNGALIKDVNIEGEMEAKIEKKEESFVITINPNVFSKRQRFSVAHELGHLFLHMGYLINPQKWEKTNEYCDSVYYRNGYNTEELEANEFAGCLLMPAEEFLKVAQENLKDGYYDFEKIADHFEVSVPSVTYRSKLLGILE